MSTRVTFDRPTKLVNVNGTQYVLTLSEVRRAVPEGDSLHCEATDQVIGVVTNFGMDDDNNLWVDISPNGQAWVMPP